MRQASFSAETELQTISCQSTSGTGRAKLAFLKAEDVMEGGGCSKSLPHFNFVSRHDCQDGLDELNCRFESPEISKHFW